MVRSNVSCSQGMNQLRGVELLGSAAALLLPAITAAAGMAQAPALRGIDGIQPPAHVAFARDAEPITAPAFSIVASPSNDRRSNQLVSSLSITGSGSADDGKSSPDAESEKPRTNYLGETVEAASTRFWEDFEDGQVGPEWAASAPITESESEGRFSYIPTEAGLALNLMTKQGEVYEAQIDLLLFPPATARGKDAPPENGNLLMIKVDGHVVVQFAPEDIEKLRGEAAVAGEPIRRKIRVPFNAGFGIAEMRFEAADPSGASDWSRWAIDNILVDLGLQDPVFGFSGKMSPFDPGLLGMTGLTDGLTGELPPGRRFGNNDNDFSGGGGGGGGGGSPGDRSIPSPGSFFLGALALMTTLGVRRRDEAAAIRP